MTHLVFSSNGQASFSTKLASKILDYASNLATAVGFAHAHPLAHPVSWYSTPLVFMLSTSTIANVPTTTFLIGELNC